MKSTTTKDRFRELAVLVMRESHEPLTSIQVREKVLTLAKSRGKSIFALSSIEPRGVYSTLAYDKRRRFRQVNAEPITWQLEHGEKRTE